MEVLIFYRRYKSFGSAGIRDCVVIALPHTTSEEISILESDFPLLDINHNLDSEGYSSYAEILPKHRPSKQLSTMCSGRLSKNSRELMNHQLQARFGSLTKYQKKRMRELLKSGELELWGRLCLDVILPIVSECQIYQGIG